MKKKNFKSLKLNKNSISNFSYSVIAGADVDTTPSRNCEPTIKDTVGHCYCTIDYRFLCVGSIDQCDVRETQVLSLCYCPS